MDMNLSEAYIKKIEEWVRLREGILATLLVGSWAQGTARPDSDIDFLLIVSNPKEFLEGEDWMADFGKVKEIRSEDFGLVQGRRVFYQEGVEVEFGITTQDWLKADPVDAGTHRVLNDGYRVLNDKTGILREFINKTGILPL